MNKHTRVRVRLPVRLGICPRHGVRDDADKGIIKYEDDKGIR